MSFNNRNFNPNIWDPPRSQNPPPLFNNQPNFPFLPNNNFQNQNRPNFFPQNISSHGNNQMRPFGDDRPNFRKFHGPDFRNNNIQQQQRGGRNFQNTPPPKWKDNRKNDNTQQRDSRQNESFERSDDKIKSQSPIPPPSADDRSIVEQLKIKAAKINTKQQESSSNNDNIDTFAKNVSKKLLTEIKTTDKGDIKDLINNPKQPHVKAALQHHALEKLRRGMRKQLKTLSGAEEDTDFFDAQESVELKDIPQTLIAQMGQELGVDDMDLSSFEDVTEDKEMAVVENNLGNDFLFGSEQLLMNGFSLLGENENEHEIPPPLPSEPIKPPEPVPAPVTDAFTSAKNPWTSAPPPPLQKSNSSQRFYNDEVWDLESAKNPDPPTANNAKTSQIAGIGSNRQKNETQIIPVITTNRSRSETPINENPLAVAVANIVKPESLLGPNTPGTPHQLTTPKQQQSQQKPIEDEMVCPTPFTSNGQQQAPADKIENVEQQDQQVQSEKSNETYGDYKRRNHPPNNNNNFNKPRPLNQQNRPGPNRSNDWDADENSTPRSTSSNDNWMSNNRRNNNNNNDRMSRQDQNRSRDRNNFRRRSNSRDNKWNNDRNEINSSEQKDGFNYRFDSKDGGIDKLNAIIKPKTQFKGSFNKNRMGPRDFMNRNRSRERTPTNTEGEFGDFQTMPSSSKDVRPCYFMLKRIIEMDTEMMHIHDKIHGIDKVIQNLQSERIGYQKKYSQIQHDRKIIFDNLLKRSQYNEASNAGAEKSNENYGRDHSEKREKSPALSNKANANKKLQNMVEQKKRKAEPEPIAVTAVEEPAKKKKIMPIEEPKTAAQRQKEKEEKELKERLEKIRKQKQLRREKEEAERKRLEEEALKASNDVIIKLEKVKKSQKQNEQAKTEMTPKPFTFNSNEFLNASDYKLKTPVLTLKKLNITQNYIDAFKCGRFPQVQIEEWQKWSSNTVAVKEEPKVIEKEVQIVPDVEKDPLAIDEQPLTNPPTPGGNLATLENDENVTDPHSTINYDEWAGNFDSHDSPIVYLQNIDGQHMICAAEDGKLLKYRLTNGQVDAVFDQHSQICNAFLYDQKENIVYTASSDGYVFRIKFKSFQSIDSKCFNESLQVIEKLKSTIYVGAKSGNIFKVKSDLSNEDDNESNEPLCCVEGLILCLKASKEGPRSILLIASRGKSIQVRDATDGLLLRTLANEMSNVSVYDMAIDGSTIYCGCNLNDIFVIDFTNGALKKKRKMLGAGAICVKIYKQFLIAACYDGNIYIFDIESDDESAVNITGPSNMLLAMDLWDNKMIASTKDKTVKIMNIPT